MDKYFLEHFLGYWRELRLFRISSILPLVITAPLASALTVFTKEKSDFLLPNIPIIGKILLVDRDLVPALTVREIKLLAWFILFLMFRWLLDSLYSNLLERDSKNQKKITFEFETQKDEETNQLIWDLPSHYEINLIQHDYGKQKGISESAVRKIPFKDKAGMFGFRNYGDEIATVKSLIIEPLK